jgi:TatD DNase family protein
MPYPDFPHFPTDVHTHHHRRDAIVNISVDEAMTPDLLYSIGVHPWHAETWNDDVAARLTAKAHDPRVLAIGEAGLDKLRGPDMETQMRAFEEQARIAESVGKPLIIHCVGRYNEIMSLRKRMHPSVAWIIHGFRGKPQLAQQLLDAGFHISLGERHNPETRALLDAHPDRLMFESDEAETTPDTWMH